MVAMMIVMVMMLAVPNKGAVVPKREEHHSAIR